jgi:hypothetical protein
MLTLLIGVLSITVWELRNFGDPGPDDEFQGQASPSTVYLWDNETGTRIEVNRTQMDDYFLETSQLKETSTNNVVTAVVFDYRGFDTLGEATVLFAAVTGVLIAIRKAFPKKNTSSGGERQ